MDVQKKAGAPQRLELIDCSIIMQRFAGKVANRLSEMRGNPCAGLNPPLSCR